MAINDQVPRQCLAWLLIAQVILIAPHLERLPPWVLLAWGVCSVWRWMVYSGRWSFPGGWIKFCLIIACCFGVYSNYRSLIGLEPTVALLFSGCCLKLIELASRRDAYLLIFLGYFLALTELLFVQNMLVTLYLLVAVTCVTAALLALHQSSRQHFSWQPLRKSAVMLAQAVPLMALLFLVFPRFQPLWSVPMPSGKAQTGMSDSMEPGQVAELSRSSRLAFRVKFADRVPAPEQWYWRGLLLTQFDGRRWTQSPWKDSPMPEENLAQLFAGLGTGLRYRVFMEPTHRPWLFALHPANSAHPEVIVTADLRLVKPGGVHESLSFDVESWPAARIQDRLPRLLRRRLLALPERSNPRSRDLAVNLFAQSLGERDYVNRVLRRFREQPYVYTLKPPPLGLHSVDEFLFDTRRGFCEHYASSFVVLMRAAGIPARVVAGYQGGELNPITQTVAVRQFDAHAWAEFWLDGEGWVRVDPTAAVAPDRIERGLEDAVTDEFLEDEVLSPMRYRDWPLLNNLRLRLDAMDYYYTTWVMEYRGNRQINTLRQLLGDVSIKNVAVFFVGGAVLVLALVALSLLRVRRRPDRDPVAKLYLRFCEQLRRKGFERSVGEGPQHFAERVAAQRPEWEAVVRAVTRYFLALQYQKLSDSQRDKMRRGMRELVRKGVS